MSFKEWWQSIRYWIKGGLIGLMIGILPVIFLLFNKCNGGGEGCALTGSAIILSYMPFMFIFYKLVSIFYSMPAVVSQSMIYLEMIFAILCYAAIGALIGWIIGKRKQRKIAQMPSS